MTDDFVQLPNDSVGKKMRTINQVVGANTTEAEVIHIASPTNASGLAEVNSSGQLSVSVSGDIVQISGQGVATSISGNAVVAATSGVNQVTVSASGGVALMMETSSNPNLRVSVWGGTTQANAGGFGAADTNSPNNGSLLVTPYNMIFDAGGNVWTRMKSIPSTSGTAGVSIVGVGPMGLEPDGNFYPVKATSGALNVSTSGTGAVTIAVSGGLVLQAGDTGANTNLRVSIWNGTQQVGTGNMTADGNSAADLDLKTESRTALFNGSTWDRARSAPAASGTNGIGLLGVVLMAWNGTNFEPLLSSGGHLRVWLS